MVESREFKVERGFERGFESREFRVERGFESLELSEETRTERFCRLKSLGFKLSTLSPQPNNTSIQLA